MKKLVIALGIVLAVAVLAVAAALVLPALVPAESIKEQVARQVKTATGRDLTIDGKVSVSVFPSLSVEVSNIALSSPPGFSARDLLRLGALEVKLRVLPLLSGRVEMASFVLIDPTLTLQLDRKGRSNWAFDTARAAETAAPPAPAAAPAGADLNDVVLGDVRLRNGTLVYLDDAAGAREEVPGIDLSIALKGLDDPLAAAGSLIWRGRPVELALNLTLPRALLEGQGSAASARLATEALKLSFAGDLSGGATAGAKGLLELSVPSVRGLMTWVTGRPPALAGDGLGPLSLTGTLNAAGSNVALTQAKITLDALKAQGDIAFDGGGPRPALKGRLDTEILDLNPYLPPPAPATGPAAAASGGNAAPADWSDTPIDASALRAADVDFALAAAGIRVRRIEVGKSALRVQLNNGRLTADLSEMALYQGNGKARVILDAAPAGLGVDASVALKGVQAGPLLAAAADFDRLTGSGAIDLHLAGRGATERQLVASLDGNGAISFADGAITGINLAEMVRNVGSAFAGTGGTQKTDFAELGGTFTVVNGIVNNQDLALKSPLLRVEGKGSAELPPRTVHYRVEPKAVASLEGQGGKADLGGIQVPVIIEGRWDNLSYRPDLEAMLKGQAGKAVQESIGNKAGGSGGSSSDQPKSLPLSINPGSLFGR